MVDLAKERGLKERTSKVPNVVLTDAMEQRIFDAWDTNFDGKVSADEVRFKKRFVFYVAYT